MKIALIGKSAAGKDTVKNLLIKKGLKPNVSFTTRPPRTNERNGISYYFVTDDVFHQVEMLEKVCFRGWWYGTGVAEFQRAQLFIFTPTGLSLLPQVNRDELLVVYLTVSPVVQLERLKKRGDDPSELNRRIESDRADFENYIDYNFQYTSDEHSAEEIAEGIWRINLALERQEIQLAENRTMMILTKNLTDYQNYINNSSSFSPPY